jgi:site-specific recombinase XerD
MMSLQNWNSFKNGLKLTSASAYEKRIEKYEEFCAEENLDMLLPISLHSYLTYLHENDLYSPTTSWTIY